VRERLNQPAWGFGYDFVDLFLDRQRHHALHSEFVEYWIRPAWREFGSHSSDSWCGTLRYVS